MERKFYLKMKDVAEIESILDRLPLSILERVYIPAVESLGWVTAEDIYAQISNPHYNAAAMDGIACEASRTFGASEQSPLTLDTAVYQEIDTGDPIPESFNAVIPFEEVSITNDRRCIIHRSAHPWQNIRIVGEDIVRGELLLTEGTMIDPKDITLLLAGGVEKLPVKKKPQVAIIPTGNEIVKPPVSVLKPGMIVDYNSPMIATHLSEWGCTAFIHDPVPDDFTEISRVLEETISKMDIVILIAGSSAGSEDYTASILQKLGRLEAHGVRMMPGKPFICGYIKNTPVFGLPGFPASTYITLQLFVKRYIERLLGTHFPSIGINCTLAQDVPSRLGYDEYIRVVCTKINGMLKAIPLKRGASIFKSIQEATGYFVIPRTSEGTSTGTEIHVQVLDRHFKENRTILIVGSNDIAIDRMKTILSSRFSDYKIISINRGSLGGLVSLKNHESHAAPIHLLDPATGGYNDTYIRDLFKGEPVVVLTVAQRAQGIIVQRGNPLYITSIEDIANHRYVNRQKGSGTRVLFDYLISNKGISPDIIDGYSTELYTHLAVCNFIANGYADCGLGIKSAADSFELDFIPIAEEPYELAFRLEFLMDERYRILHEVIESNTFKKSLQILGGYDTATTGKIREIK